MRSVRKLELTNQIIKEAYAAVQETLLAERQSKETQLQALERKHQDDMLKLVEEYQERAEQQQQQQRLGLGRSYLGSDSDICDYDYDVNHRNTSSVNTSSTPSSVPVSNEYDDEDDEDDDAISIMWVRDGDCDGSDADTESIYSSSSSEDSDEESDSECDSDSESNALSDSEDDDNSDDGFGDDSQVVFEVDETAKSTSGSGSENESENDIAHSSDGQNDDSELSDYSVEPSAPQLNPKHLLSPDDYADIDLAAAVISRYYANGNGTLDIAADIEDIPVDDDHVGSDDGNFITDSRFSKSDDQAPDSLNSQSIWDAMRDPSMSGVVEDTSKSYDDREMERIVQLPADQRIAKFINRASSHLQQGARGGLSL
ncbi:hypothetical protein LPJ73_006600, partial [Coemansia sp. RSA 2703]